MSDLAYRNPTTGKPEAQDGINGAAHVTDGALAAVVVASGGNTYICEAVPGTLAATAAWRCQCITATGTTTWADGNSNFDNSASAPAGLTYS